MSAPSQSVETIPSGRVEGLAGEVVVELDGVEKRFRDDGGTLTALERIDLRVAEGSFVSVVGPSGCGKSTLLNLVAGFVAPSAGSVSVRGRPVRGIDPALGVGYVTQDNKLFPWLTLRGNVEFPLRVRGWSSSRRRERVEELLELVGLEGFEDRYLYQLSGGMQKRAALAQALSYEPSVLLADEPFGSLDAQTRMVLQDELLRIWQENRTTILFVTHDLTEAIALSDRVVALSRRPGRVKGEIRVALPRPRDVFHIHDASGYPETYDALWELLGDELALDGRRRSE